MSKATIVRKKALDLVRRQDWQGAIREYKRLVEMDQSNPNVHNELADIYLKSSSKGEAYDCFVRAIDEYTRVGLYNNAVAVAKKVMRVLPARTEVLALLGNVRMKQGLVREAESYYLSFLDKAAGGAVNAAEFKKIAREMAACVPESVPVLHKLSQCMLSLQLDEEAGDVLVKLYALVERAGNPALLSEVRSSIDKLGIAARLPAASASGGADPGRTVVTEQNIWTDAHAPGDRIDIESTPRFAPSAGTSPPAPAPAANGPSERELYLLRLARGVGGSAPRRKPEPDVPIEEPADPPVVTGETPAVAEPEDALDPVDAPEPAPEPETRVTEVEDEDEAPAPSPSPLPAATGPKRAPAGDHTQISVVTGENDDDADDDYRSHYDLGMAYMEMDLLPEAIREYQAASRSPQFQVKCLEMIGLCFVRQKQPQLAIKQLNKGLGLIDTDTEEALGMKYNLGLAYEMVGDVAAARALFEDVYVVDVTFRDVAEKVANLAGKA